MLRFLRSAAATRRKHQRAKCAPRFAGLSATTEAACSFPTSISPHNSAENFKDVQLIPGIHPFLETLETAGLRAGIATSASSSRTWGTLQRLKLDNKFVTVVTGDDVTAGKPDPAVYRLAAQRMNLSPDELLVLEDAPCGVQAAKSAGMRCFGVTSNGRMEALRRAGADHIISNFLDLSIEKLLQLWIAIPGNNDSPSRSGPSAGPSQEFESSSSVCPGRHLLG